MCLLLWSTAACWATASISWVGVFTEDNQMFLASFTLPSEGEVTIQSWGFAGGVNAVSQTIPPGGFATALALFEDSGSQDLIASDTLGGTPPSDCGPRNQDSGECLDAYLQLTLSPGAYFFVLTQQGNTPAGGTFGDGFTGYGSFLDPFTGAERTGNWAVDLVGPDDMITDVPEPGAALPLAAALIWGLWRVRRRPRVGA
jgi:hypothetical protein